MRISVAMCTYNGQMYIREQLESLACQELLPKELILCDDGSTDATLSIVEAFAERSPFPVKIFRNTERLGYQQNFVRASNLCSEDIIALCDQDDVWYCHKLSLLSELFAREGEMVGGVFSNGDLIDSESKPLGRDIWTSFGFGRFDQERFRSGAAVDVLLQRNVVTGMCVAFRSRWRDQLESMPESWYHDAWLALMLASRGRLVACPEKLAAYRVHDRQQVGVSPGIAAKYRYIKMFGLTAYVRLSRDRNLNEYRKSAGAYDDLLVAIEQAGTEFDELRAKASEKAKNMHHGFELLTAHWSRRWPSVLSGVKNYHRYSPTGLHAMLRDLIL